MQIRCQNCGARLSVPPGELREVKCPRCGVLMMLPPPDAPMPPSPRGALRRSHASLKRVYEPIPRPVVYLAGAGLALLLTSPFWVYVFKEKFSRRPVIIADDTHDIVVPPLTNTPVPTGPLADGNDTGTLTFDRYHGVRLEVGKEDLQRRFNLRLQNTRGMMPEIYEAEREGDVDQMIAFFYGNSLKEFSFQLRPQRNSPEEIQRELVNQFGEPKQVQESANTASGIGLSGLGNADTPAQKLTAFPKRRDVSWTDDQNSVDATIYYDPAQPHAVLSVRVSSAAWLKSNHPRVTAIAPSNALERPVMPNP